MALPKVYIRRVRTPRPNLPSPIRPQADPDREAEVLVGEVQGMKASMPEERLHNALAANRNVQGLEFRYTLGAPRGLPGWFELDYLVASGGQHYAIEVDTEFSHRMKVRSDALHDARVLKSLRGQGLTVYPSVIHLDGETDLADPAAARSAVGRLFGPGGRKS